MSAAQFLGQICTSEDAQASVERSSAAPELQHAHQQSEQPAASRRALPLMQGSVMGNEIMFSSFVEMQANGKLNHWPTRESTKPNTSRSSLVGYVSSSLTMPPSLDIDTRPSRLQRGAGHNTHGNTNRLQGVHPAQYLYSVLFITRPAMKSHVRCICLREQQRQPEAVLDCCCRLRRGRG